MHYDKKGNPIDFTTYVRLMNREYVRVGYNELNNCVVSTVWVGIDGGAYTRNQSPMIFETMVFPGPESYTDLDVEKYSTEEDAKIGHIKMIYRWALKYEDKS
jgi:hypothetical protein